MNNFVVFSSGYNCEKFIRFNIESIRSQKYKRFKHIIVDDGSTDNTYKEIQKYKYQNLKVYRNKTNQKWIKNAVKYLDENIVSEEDIIVLIDLDDWLFDDKVFDILNVYYNNPNCWITSSNFMYRSRNLSSNWIPEYPKNVINSKDFRKTVWSFTHLRTFKAFLWNNLDKEDLKDENGEYFKCCYDQALCLPMLEMASHHYYHIQKMLYIYNDVNPLQVEKINRGEQERNAKYIRSKEKYSTLLR